MGIMLKLLSSMAMIISTFIFLMSCDNISRGKNIELLEKELVALKY